MDDLRENVNQDETAVHNSASAALLSSNPPRQLTVYDAVAGRAGLNGFLTQEQKQSENVLPIAPEEVLLRRSTIPEHVVNESYDLLSGTDKLPGSEMLKAVHAYASDFYSRAVPGQGTFDFRTLDETALIAFGILLEEAVKETLGQDGDMVFVEPEGLKHGLDETKLTKYQVKGRVKTAKAPKMESSEDSLPEDESPAKKPRR
ncbi:uncharacterized protein Z520_06621 [Fonsecaea multimorphosa CBS 102226]|uniref:Uncharacterized protein n=1 Tax=Fonsecaea multimorphosa CBS 102226 TaxID=1442371 RepID=A0A0D2KMD6_9EURO|nr:uncharacterized protein Z520_06621 [Fonsecaea multimorphosa CBS 102226]KIX97843.1 hypothetical protein Z520_06621 [Fonsecaea multimorphosa CBS 102226]OAL23613.1 hypothetical protein AYO22_06190 [Fonsecaea multimorphosa]